LDFFLLTRFAEIRNSTKIVPGPEWVASRLAMLRDLLLPSVQAQKYPFTKWYISVHEGFDQIYLRQLEGIIGDIGNVVIQSSGQSSFEVFRSVLPQDGNSYYTLRVDSDDAIASNFSEAVIDANILPHEVVSFRRGQILNIDTGAVAQSRVPTNPFLVSWGVKGSNIFGLGLHGEINQKAEVSFRVIETAQPMWSISIHGKNVANQFPAFYRPENIEHSKVAFPHLSSWTRRNWFASDSLALFFYLLSSLRRKIRRFTR
jgi:hypothetical protein